jgi:heme exporter protein C
MVFLYIAMMLVLLGAFMYAPLAKGLGEFTRVLYFHVPVSWIMVIAFFISAWYSVIYLRKRDILCDQYAEMSSQLGIIFGILATITGAMWSKVSWGAYWNWDPRQTSIFILLLIYAAYFSLRSAVDEDTKRARLSAVYLLIAFASVPFFVFIVPRIYESLHPDPIINQEGKINMESKMLTVFLLSMTVFTIIFFWMMYLKKTIINLNFQYKKLTEGDH